MIEVLTVAEAAAVARRHPVTVRKALEAGALHGWQQVPGGRWSIDARCVEAWIMNERCPHAGIVPLRPGSGR